MMTIPNNVQLSTFAKWMSGSDIRFMTETTDWHDTVMHMSCKVCAKYHGKTVPPIHG